MKKNEGKKATLSLEWWNEDKHSLGTGMGSDISEDDKDDWINAIEAVSELDERNGDNWEKLTKALTKLEKLADQLIPKCGSLQSDTKDALERAAYLAGVKKIDLKTWSKTWSKICDTFEKISLDDFRQKYSEDCKEVFEHSYEIISFLDTVDGYDGVGDYMLLRFLEDQNIRESTMKKLHALVPSDPDERRRFAKIGTAEDWKPAYDVIHSLGTSHLNSHRFAFMQKKFKEKHGFIPSFD